MKLFMIFIGGGAGSMLRYGVGILFSAKSSFHPLLATLSVNAIGSLILGVLVAYFTKQNLQNENIALALTIGLCGGFTTFSTFSLEVFNLLRSGDFLQAGIYILVSILVSVALLFCGWKLFA
ncbi:fluoride efflux transporter CrcB [Salibacteraceae bacterium]|jgi:fluoride exporter|nr:fluoride efflux transporter CrcB [Crocinitomicaceae bacterium]MCH9823368.1 fluoride efflux transporter CrcB [Bacteroidota bacterium]MDC1204297.1 fluoride efflux transporter CrcB [Salibacteraceae bacterium]|tara:strand:- start:25981 stop:26346 length:366 start_codon:yes stop_codon:yes gene_type:complete